MMVACPHCHRKMVPMAIGVEVCEFKDKELTKPYKFYSADLLGCNCTTQDDPGFNGRRVLYGFSQPTHAHSLTEQEIKERMENVKVKFF